MNSLHVEFPYDNIVIPHAFHSSSSWLLDVAIKVNWFTVFGCRSVLYPFGLVIPVHSVIVYAVFPVFTLNTYSIPGFTVPAETVKLLDGVMLFDMSSIVIAFHVRVCHWKSEYFMSHTPDHVSCHLKLLLSSYHKFCPTCGEFDDLTLCGFNLVTIIVCF
jgi:hypothetical protein